MPSDDTDDNAPPWPQRLYDSVWLIAGTAILYGLDWMWLAQL